MDRDLIESSALGGLTVCGYELLDATSTAQHEDLIRILCGNSETGGFGQGALSF